MLLPKFSRTGRFSHGLATVKWDINTTPGQAIFWKHRPRATFDHEMSRICFAFARSTGITRSLTADSIPLTVSIGRYLCKGSSKHQAQTMTDIVDDSSEICSQIQRFRSVVQYDGTDFSGFQRQVCHLLYGIALFGSVWFLVMICNFSSQSSGSQRQNFGWQQRSSLQSSSYCSGTVPLAIFLEPCISQLFFCDRFESNCSGSHKHGAIEMLA